ncbi:MAG: NAD(P)H-dependent oxidoreductase subunit E [Bacteroidales bacterium]|jgi:NADH-quinone oxidoreductase subunit E|nr:NAD(P)H-dependent oxidoreductase subunit E [Bacteroidales bacterium]
MKTSDILRKFSPEHKNMLNILHAIQDNNPYNYLAGDDLKEVAAYLNTTLSHVYGVATYYTMLSVKPRGKYIIRACNSPVCLIEGSLDVLEELKQLLDTGIGETTADRLFTLEVSECLGHCAMAPVMMINDRIYGNLDRKKIADIINEYKNK